MYAYKNALSGWVSQHLISISVFFAKIREKRCCPPKVIVKQSEIRLGVFSGMRRGRARKELFVRGGTRAMNERT
jgi:hypothetical protein